MPSAAPSRIVKVAVAAAAVVASATLSGCGFDVQTLQPYTPAQGINVNADGGPKVRNLLVIANTAGKGRLSASILATKDDSLASVEVTALKADNSPAGSLTVGSTKVALPARQLVVLTAPGTAAIPVAGADLKPGGTANVKLTFGNGSMVEAVVPVMSASDPIYATAAPELK